MDQYEYINSAGDRTFASSPGQVTENLGEEAVVRRRGSGKPGQIPENIDDRQVEYLAALQRSLEQSKMERDRATMDYNPTVGEMMGRGTGGTGPTPEQLAAQPYNGPADSIQGIYKSLSPETGNAQFTNIKSLIEQRRTPGDTTGFVGARGPATGLMSEYGTGADNFVSPPGGSQGQPDMRMDRVREILANSKGLPAHIQDEIFSNIFGVSTDAMRKKLEHALTTKGDKETRIEMKKLDDKTRDTNHNTKNQMNLFNKSTGKRLAEDSINPGVGIKPSDTERVENEYMQLSEGQQKDAGSLVKLDRMIGNLEEVFTEMGWRKSGPGVLTKGVGIKTLRTMGDRRVQKFDAVMAELGTIVSAFGADSRPSDTENANLKNALPKDFDSAEGVLEKLRLLESFRNSRAEFLGLPWMKERRGIDAPMEKSKFADVDPNELASRLRKQVEGTGTQGARPQGGSRNGNSVVRG